MIGRIITRGRNSGLKCLSTGSLPHFPFPFLAIFFPRELVHRLLKHVPNYLKYPLNNGQFFQRLTKKLGMVMTLDAYGELMINRGSCILIVLHLHCCSKHKLSTILIANAVSLARFVTSRHIDSKKLFDFLCILSLRCIMYDWITVMKYSKHEISTINMLYSLRKICQITPLPPRNGHLSTTATFFCPQGGHCGDVRL